jgi:glycosyltransferase involved in cell wall biosynthesis
VLAIIPHYGCEEWLEWCLHSIVSQTRPPDGIVVVDDASQVPPKDIVERFPNVTLLTSVESVGPYRLKQQVINQTNYDGYLLQDADDWSSNSRLELLLNEAQRTGADIVASQEIRFYWDREQVVPVTYPADVNAMLEQNKVCDPLLHPACLFSRDILRRLNGFATGLRFAGDTEFLLRARYAAKMVNVPFYCYFKRKRAGSLTMSPETGIRSPARTELVQKLIVRGTANAEAKANGRMPDLMPSPVAGPVQLIHVTGPSPKAA